MCRSWSDSSEQPSSERPSSERQRFSSTHATYHRKVFASKTGLAVVLASLLSLCSGDRGGKVIDSAPWAVVTAVIVSQQTMGATAHKAVQRCVGTTFAAALAAAAGYSAALLSPSLVAPVVLALELFLFTVFLNYLSTAAEFKKWNYAIFLSYLTFDFLALKAYKESAAASLYRMLMISVGAAIALAVHALPPRVAAAEQVEGMLADTICDCADALIAAVRAYTEGRQLRRLESIDVDVDVDDDIHSKYAAAITSRAAFKEALTAAAWESCSGNAHKLCAACDDIGRTARRLAYTVFALDNLLRSQPLQPPRHDQPHEANLLRQMLAAAKVMHHELHRCACDIEGKAATTSATRPGISGEYLSADGGDNALWPSAVYDAASQRAPHAAADLRDSVDALRAALAECAVGMAAPGGHGETLRPNLVAFVELVLATAARVEKIIVATSRLAADRIRADQSSRRFRSTPRDHGVDGGGADHGPRPAHILT